MLTATNTGPKTIGFGAERILPGETKALPAGFGESHPTVRFFMDRGWLAKTSAGGVLVPPGTAAASGAPQGESPENPQGEAPAPPLSRRALERMKLEELRELAAGKGLETNDGIAKAALVEMLAEPPEAGR